MRFLFVGGGTGGHLAPALGLAEALRERGHETLFLSGGREVEQDFLREAGPAVPLGTERGRLPRPLRLLRAMVRARRQARAFRPDLVVGLGGLTGAAALAARRGRPLVLLEGNRVVGRGVRLLRPFASGALTLFPEPAAELPNGVCVGPVGRRALRPRPPAEARAHFGLPAEGPVLLLTGGSQGALALNRAVAAAAAALAADGVRLLAAAGPGKEEELRRAAVAAGLTAVVRGHLAEMGAAYSAADLALCRGGAATVAELWLHRLPAVIVPYPGHADRQQVWNARALEPGVEMVEEPAAAVQRARELLADEALRARMRTALAATAPADGLEQGVRILEEIAGRRA